MPFSTGWMPAFAMTTPLPGGTEQETATGIVIADAAARADVPHLVFSSVGGAERDSGVPHFESKRRIEEHIEALGIRHTFLRPVLFMDNLSGFMTSIEDGEVVVRMALPDGIPLQMVAVRDVGRAAAAILLGGTAVEGGDVEIAGDTLTGSQIAKAIAAYAGLPARYEALPLEAIASFGERSRDVPLVRRDTAYQADFEATRALVPDPSTYPRGWPPPAGTSAPDPGGRTAEVSKRQRCVDANVPVSPRRILAHVTVIVSAFTVIAFAASGAGAGGLTTEPSVIENCCRGRRS